MFIRITQKHRTAYRNATISNYLAIYAHWGTQIKKAAKCHLLLSYAFATL